MWHNLCCVGLFPRKFLLLFIPLKPNLQKQSLYNQILINRSLSIFRFYYHKKQTQNLTPLNRPLYIQIQEGEPSPYLKQLLSKVGSSQIQFLDFTLENNHVQQLSMQQNSSQEEDYDGQNQNRQMSVIDQQYQSQHQNINFQKGENMNYNHDDFKYNPQEYIPNMHLLDIPPAFLSFQYFKSKVNEYKHKSIEEMREFLYLYLTDDDLQTYKDAQIDHLIKVIEYNLLPFGIISKLERKTKVTRYLQKKKKRIWKKKINYDCRKKVADNRLRVKGKFVTRQQACIMLGIDLCSQQQLKQKLNNNYHNMMY